MPYAIAALMLLGGCGTRSFSIPDAAEPSDSLAAMDSAQLIAGETDPSASVLPDDGAPTIEAVSGEELENGEAGGANLDAALELVEAAREAWAAGEQDRAIEMLDQAYGTILSTSGEGSDKELLQQKEDLRFMISKRLLEIYASQYRTVNGTHKEIPLTVNEHVEREIKLFQTRERDFFLESYRRSGRYRDYIAQEFREAGLPEDLSWLPLIESGFKVRALSRARALGLWQFIPSTGYKFGLKRNAAIDERLDPEKATAAAIAYLKELHQIFGDWATVLAAYNCGEGAVLRVIRSQKIDYLDNFWDLYHRLPSETARYYPRFLATLAIIKDPAKYGFELGETDQPLPYEVVTIDKAVNLKKLAAKLDVPAKELTGLNPELRYKATPKGAYDLKVPLGMGELAMASVEGLPTWSPPKPAYVVHRVRRGETLSSIALRYRTSIRRIRDANHLRSIRYIRAGQRLRIPVSSAS